MLLSVFSLSAWLAAYEHPVVDRINQRIEDITGLDVKTAEELQVVFMRPLMQTSKNSSVRFLFTYTFSFLRWQITVLGDNMNPTLTLDG